MKDYMILENTSTHSLTKEVMFWISGGWKPQGGVAVLASGIRTYYTQAMVKE